MSAADWSVIAESIVGIYLLWQQNQIFKKQNEIFAAQAGKSITQPESFTRVALRRYWPMLTMGLLMVLTWTAAWAAFYDRHYDQPDIPEFDGSNADLVLAWGQDTTGVCDMTVNGKRLLGRQSGFKLAIGCFIYDGKEDVLDAPYIQVSSLYDIRDGVIAMRSSYQPYFLEYYKQMHPTGTEIALFNVPNGVQPNQFTTLRQARSLGVKIPYIKIVRPGE